MTEAQKLLDSLSKYMALHPEQRFWQAVRNWSGFSFIFVSNVNDIEELKNTEKIRDTYYFEEKLQ